MRSEHQDDVGNQIARLRAERGWSQRELAKIVRLDQSAVSRIEAGRRRVSAAELQRFADLFHVSADALLGADDETAGAGTAWGPAGSTEVRTPIAARAMRRPPGRHELITAIERARGFAADERFRAESSSPAREAPMAPAPVARTSPPAIREALARGFLRAAAYGAVAPGPGARRAAADQAPGRDLPPKHVAGDDWASDIAAVVRDWFVLRALTEQPQAEIPWSTGQTAEGKPAFAPRPWQPVIPPPGSGDVLYDRVARFWRSELHVDPDDGPLPDLVPLFENGLGIQIVVARVQGVTRAFTERAGLVSDPRPVAATVVSDGVPFVFVNAGRPVVLQRFALVHSFAHLALGHGDVVDESIGWSRANPPEAAANDFSEEFLAPVRAVERWYGRRTDLPKSPSLDTLLELANAFGITAWAALFRTRAAGRLNPKQFAALRAQMRREEWDLLPRQSFLGGIRDTLSHLTPAEVLPVGEFGPPTVLRVPACMRAWALAALRDRLLGLEDAATLLRLRPGALADQLDALGLA